MKWTYMYFETHDLLGRVDGLYSTFCSNKIPASKPWHESKYTLYIVSSTNNIIITCIYMFLNEMRRKKERSKQRQTNKQGKATQHTQGSHFS